MHNFIHIIINSYIYTLNAVSFYKKRLRNAALTVTLCASVKIN